MVMNSCPFLKKDGTPCQAKPTRSGHCVAHDPALEQKRQQARQRGGAHKSRLLRMQQLMPPDLQTLDEVLSQAIAGVFRGNMAPAQGSSISALVSAKCKLRELSLRIMEQTELTNRIKKLEERINELGLTDSRNGRPTRKSF